MMVCIPVLPAAWKGRMGGLWFKAIPTKMLVDHISTNKTGMVVCVYNPSYTRGIGVRIVVQVGQGMNVRPYQKLIKAERA
jgi:hypothetical protein